MCIRDRSDAVARHSPVGSDEGGGPYPPQRLPGRLEALHAGFPRSSLQASVHRQMLVASYGETQRVVLPVFREVVEEDTVLRLHLIPQARAGQRRQNCLLYTPDAADDLT